MNEPSLQDLKKSLLKRAYGLPFEVKTMAWCENCRVGYYGVVCPQCKSNELNRQTPPGSGTIDIKEQPATTQ